MKKKQKTASLFEKQKNFNEKKKKKISCSGQKRAEIVQFLHPGRFHEKLFEP